MALFRNKNEKWLPLGILLAIILSSFLYSPEEALAAVSRKIRLFEGYKIKLVSGKIVQHSEEGCVVCDTGFMSPTAAGDAFNDWTNPTNAFSSNDTYATETIHDSGQDYYNFNFSIPAGATINGIEVAMEAHDSSCDCSIFPELSWDGGTYIGHPDPIIALTASDAIYTTGGSSDDWGRSWDDSEFSNGNFRLRSTVSILGGGTISVDHVQVKVYYTP